MRFSSTTTPAYAYTRSCTYDGDDAEAPLHYAGREVQLTREQEAQLGFTVPGDVNSRGEVGEGEWGERGEEEKDNGDGCRVVRER